MGSWLKSNSRAKVPIVEKIARSLYRYKLVFCLSARDKAGRPACAIVAHSLFKNSHPFCNSCQLALCFRPQERTIAIIQRGNTTLNSLKRVYDFATYKLKETLFWSKYYAALRDPKTKGSIPHNQQIQEEIIQQLKKAKFHIKTYKISPTDYERYMQNAEYKKFQKYQDGGKAKNFIEKSLEHYVAAELLGLTEEDVYLDIASADSPTPEIYSRLYRCKVYRQDLLYPEGIHGSTIGGNASSMPLPDAFATKMGLHCSFEHFESESDINFIKEANRVLAKRGKLCIIPLYLFNRYAAQTNPALMPKGGICFENDMTVYCVKKWKNRHSRFYDVPHLIARIANNVGNLRMTLFVIQNEKIISPSCYLKFAALFEKE